MGGGCNQSPNPNNPAEYCSTVPPLHQAQASGALSSPPPTVMVPVGVLKQPGSEGKVCRILPKSFLICGLLISTFQQCSNCVKALFESRTTKLHYRYVFSVHLIMHLLLLSFPKIQTSFTHLHVDSNLYEFLLCNIKNIFRNISASLFVCTLVYDCRAAG